MAFPQPNAQRELTNRKILEELQLKKQMLLKQGAVAPLTATSISLTQPNPVSQLPMCSIPPVSATAVSEAQSPCVGADVWSCCQQNLGSREYGALVRPDEVAEVVCVVSITQQSSPAATPPLMPPINTAASLSCGAGFPQLPEANIINTSHRAALQHANATSCGYFVSQDSSFGNQILPVLPRFDNK